MKYVEKCGRVWPSKKAYDKYSDYMMQALDLSLMFESYSDDTDDMSIYEDDGFKMLDNIRKIEV